MHASHSPTHPEDGGAATSLPSTHTVRFFVLALGFTWLLQLPVVLGKHGVLPGGVEQYMGFAALGVLGPLLAAVLCARREPGGSARDVFRPLMRWRVGAGWYLLAFTLPGAILVGSTGIYNLFTGQSISGLFLPHTGQQVVAMFIMPFAEELGWRGWALPRMQRRYGALRASLLLGGLWAIWHLGMFEAVGVPRGLYPALLVFLIAGSVVFSWLFNRTHGSVVMMLVAHAGAHLNNSHQTLPGNTLPSLLHTAGYVVVAVALVLLDRRAWTSGYGTSADAAGR